MITWEVQPPIEGSARCAVRTATSNCRDREQVPKHASHTRMLHDGAKVIDAPLPEHGAIGPERTGRVPATPPLLRWPLPQRAAPVSYPAATTGDAPPVLPCTYVPQEKTRALRKLPPAASGAACCHSRAVGGGDIEPRGRSRCAAAPNYRAALGPHQAMCSIVTAHLVPCRAPGVRVISAPIRPRFDDRLSMTGSSDSFDSDRTEVKNQLCRPPTKEGV